MIGARNFRFSMQIDYLGTSA